MKQFLQILKFELSGYVKSKPYQISILLVCLLVSIVLFLPRFVNIFGDDDKQNSAQLTTSDKITLGIYDPTNVFTDDTMIKSGFPNATLKKMDSADALKSQVESKSVDAGFNIMSDTNYNYMVYDSSMDDMNKAVFDYIMSANYRTTKLSGLGLDVEEVNKIVQTPIQSETLIIGKDGVKNFLFTYILVFLLYFVVIFYGQMTASSVASEKGNRSIEILVTSASTNALIFGKVIAGALAGIVQVGLMLGVSFLAYYINADVWNNSLDFLFQIPLEVLLTFAVFGTLGYLFYSFIYGALGALVSKVEDVGSASSPITIIFVIAFIATFAGMSQPDSMLSTIVSYVPFSSCMAMFARIAMGSVSMIEVAISFVILFASTILMGLLAAKIYRRGTLMYGNSIKLRHMFKMLKRKD